MNKEEKLLKQYESACEEYDKAFSNLPLGLNFKEFQDALEPFSKKCAKLSREYRMVQTPEFNGDVPEYGDVMALDEFISCCKCGGFVNSDGNGNYVKDGKESNIQIKPSDVKFNSIRTDFNEIVWYNK